MTPVIRWIVLIIAAVFAFLLVNFYLPLLLHAIGLPFTAQLEFSAPTTATGTLILKNDNPSGDPAKDKQLTVPVKF